MHLVKNGVWVKVPVFGQNLVYDAKHDKNIKMLRNFEFEGSSKRADRA